MGPLLVEVQNGGDAFVRERQVHHVAMNVVHAILPCRHAQTGPTARLTFSEDSRWFDVR
jgi:hypothetical protein